MKFLARTCVLLLAVWLFATPAAAKPYAKPLKLTDPKALHYTCVPGQALRHCGVSMCQTVKCGSGEVCVESYCGSCQATCVKVSPERNCTNQKTVAPVCGRNGVTYASTCHAHRARVKILRKGRCAPKGICTCEREYAPRCGSDGRMYLNTCVARVCASAKLAPVAACAASQAEPDCYCIMIYDPVCGEDDVTYGNACEAGCKGVAIASNGSCPCRCNKLLQPVCGSEGKTYGNPCMAECAGVTNTVPGECPTTGCKVTGEECKMAGAGECCAGHACEQYPVATGGDKGRCWNTSTPMPIG